MPIALATKTKVRVLTDWYTNPDTISGRLIGCLSRLSISASRKLYERSSPDLDRLGIEIQFPILQTFLARLIINRLMSEQAYYEWCSERFACWAQRNGRLADVDCLFGFVRNMHPKLIKYAKSKKISVIGDQIIAPAREERREFEVQRERWPGWESGKQEVDFERIIDFEERSWRRLDRITCASTYVREGLLAQGVSREKICVIPYPHTFTPCLKPSVTHGKVTIGFVGNVCLRKGAPYFLEVAKKCHATNVEFVMVGPVSLAEKVIKEYEPFVRFVGGVARSQVSEWLRRFDLFFFPSTCEGSAGAVIEAMSTGLPIITSPNSGSTVRHGIDGYVFGYDDIDGFCDAITRLIENREYRYEMGQEAMKRCSKEHSLENYGNRLAGLMRGISASARNDVNC